MSGSPGTLGNGTLEITDNSTDTITFELDLGQALTGNNSVIIYIDSASGGFSGTGSFTDTNDPIRKGMSIYDGTNRSTVTFSGFSPDYAIGADSGFQDLWELKSGASHMYLGGLGIDKTGSNYAAGTYVLSLPMSAIDVSPSDVISIGAILTSNTAFLSDEAINSGSYPTPNPGQGASVTLAPVTYTVTPEPSSMILWLVAALSIVGLRSRRR